MVTAAARSHPPLAVAAFGRKGLTQAARRALPYLASPLEPLELLLENRRFHAEHLPEDTNAEALVTPVLRTVHVAADDRERTRVFAALEGEQRAAGRLARGKAPAAVITTDLKGSSIVASSRRFMIDLKFSSFSNISKTYLLTFIWMMFLY